jgi:hypothetical protein
MGKIIVELPENRAQAGSILLIDRDQKIVAGPFLALGLANRETAKSQGNPTANRLKPYGDTPYGTYAVIDIVPTGKGSDFVGKNYGNHGAIRLKPVDGEAALAARAGRTGLLIHGGVSALHGRLRPTSGSIRISEGDMRKLLEGIALLTLYESPPSVCEVRKSNQAGSYFEIVEKGSADSDPPVGMNGDWHLSALLRACHTESYFPEALGIGTLVGHNESESQERTVHDREAHDREVHDREVERETRHDRARDLEREASSPDRDPNHGREAQTHDRTAARTEGADTHDRTAARTEGADTHDRTAARTEGADTHDRTAARTEEADTHDRTAATTQFKSSENFTRSPASSKPADTHDRSPARNEKPVDTHDRKPARN